ncbi:MAG: GNAT family N-acetyltransferase [Akkermansiaceae bacterium]|nr:GNAT family N-acetyltransferase [Armatimonadota bacterium]
MKRFDSPRFLPGANFFAVDEATGEYVGVTMLWGSGGNNDLHTGMTGVRESHRKRGIATALKIHALTYAKKRGTDAVWTSNEVGNVGMLSINFRFGFEKQPEELQYTKQIK